LAAKRKLLEAKPKWAAEAEMNLFVLTPSILASLSRPPNTTENLSSIQLISHGLLPLDSSTLAVHFASELFPDGAAAPGSQITLP